MDSNCRGVSVKLCGQVRAMIKEKQHEIEKLHQYAKVKAARIEDIVLNILEEKAEEYFKKKSTQTPSPNQKGR